MPRLAELCSAIVDCEHKTAPTQASGIPQIRTNDIRNGRLDLVGARRVSEETFLLWTARGEPAEGDLIVAREAPVGEIGIVPTGTKLCLGQRTVLVRPDPEKVDSRYLLFTLLAPRMQHAMRSKAEGSTTPHLNVAEIRHLNLPDFPPLAEQRAIAGVLGALDDKIELNRRMSETLEALARQHHRAVVRRGAQQKSLGELVLVNARKRSRDFEYEEIEYVDISSVKAGYLDVPSPLRIEEAPSRAQRLVADGDTIWSCVRPNRRSYAFIDNPPSNRVVSTGFAVLTPLVVPPGFLYLAVTTDDFVDYLSANADGSAYPAVRPEHFERAEIPVPGEDALRSFEAMARPLLARIAHNDRESRTLADLRDALLPKLISGELHVRDAEAAVDAAEPT